MKQYKISIVGTGMVGGALQRYFENKPNYQLFLYDKGKNIGSIEEVNKADFIYICVPTPNKQGCDTSIVEEVISQITGEKVIIIKSTVTPGTTERLQRQYPQHRILFNPEFLTEYTADQDMRFPDRQIIGYTKESYPVAKDVIMQLPLAPLGRLVPATEAEMVKYFNNVWFATKVILCNQIYDICEKLEVDYDCLVDCVASDKRIGRTHMKIWHKGYRGFGNEKVSKCLPKDLKALIAIADEHEVSVNLLKVVDQINEKLWTKYGKEENVVVDPEVKYTSNEKKVVNNQLIK